MFQYDPAFAANEDLARQLLELVETGASEPAAVCTPPSRPTQRPAPGEALRGADAIVAHIEVNDRHGVGVLLQRLFGSSPNVISIRSQNHFGGRQEFGAWHLCIAHPERGPDAARRAVERALGKNTVARILCVPYYADDARTALALAEIFGAPLCTYLMDDQNVFADGIPDELMAELLERSSLRLAISAELALCYEIKYGRKFWLMPPVVPARHLLGTLLPTQEVLAVPRAGAILGNIWGRQWLARLRNTVRGSGITLRWYATSHLRYLSVTPEELERDSILIPSGPPLPDEDLVAVLRKTAFLVIPSGTLDEQDDRPFIARLSLPSRIPFLLATAHTPLIVLGHPETAAAKFVRERGIGVTAPYQTAAFLAAVDQVTRPAENLAMRRRALALAARFTDVGAAEWIWQSLARGEPFDLRYEDLMRRPRPDVEQLVRSRTRSKNS